MSIIDRAKNILLTPKTEWNVIASENTPAMSVLTGYIVPLAFLGSLCALVGGWLVGYGFFSSFEFGARLAITYFISAVVATYIAALVVDALAPTFNSEKDMNRSMQLVGYSYTAGLVGLVFTIFPRLGFLQFVAAIYGLYLMHLGFPIIKKTPQDKIAPYMIVSIVVLLVANWLVHWILSEMIGYNILM